MMSRSRGSASSPSFQSNRLPPIPQCIPASNGAISCARINGRGSFMAVSARVQSEALTLTVKGACDMKRPKLTALPLPQYDYGLALQTAVSWLGDRYLLAQPLPRRNIEH